MPPMGKLPPRSPLAAPPSRFSQDAMMATVRWLAADEMKGRAIGSPELDRAAEKIAAELGAAGLEPGGSPAGSWFQEWRTAIGDPPREIVLRNVIGVIRGRNEALAGQSVVVSAHYDHLGVGGAGSRPANAGRIHPGADDNASGVAVLLELARDLGVGGWQPDRSVVFAAFTGEEEGRLGSRHYVEAETSYPVSRCMGAINLDTVGRLGGGKLLVLGTGSAREWIHIFTGAGYVTGAPIECVATDPGGSDQLSFEAAGVPAVQLFSGPNADYHEPTDTPEKIDADGLEKVAAVAREAVDYLAGRAEPLTRAGAAADRHASAPAQGSGAQRRVSLGAVPDFAFAGPGVRLSGTSPGSPAEKAGLKEGDVIRRLGSAPVEDLRTLSDALKGLAPGDKVTVTYQRDGEEHVVEVVLASR
jgi:aminopeptidase N